MCLAIVALDAHPRYVTVIAANRDEFHARAATPAGWWREGWLAGRDVEGGGTWLGITRGGRWALLTNVREPERKDATAPTRGTLVPRVLASALPPASALAAVTADTQRYNGFNLVAGEGREAAWTSNRASGPRALTPGVVGLSNAALDTPWPKVLASRDRVAEWCVRGAEDPEALFTMLADASLAPDDALPRTGVSLEWERRLSAAFIVSPAYGTRCSTVVLIGRDGEVSFEERSFASDGRAGGAVRYAFTLERAHAAEARGA